MSMTAPVMHVTYLACQAEPPRRGRPRLKVLHGSTARRTHTRPSLTPSRSAIARAISSLVRPLRRVTDPDG